LAWQRNRTTPGDAVDRMARQRYSTTARAGDRRLAWQHDRAPTRASSRDGLARQHGRPSSPPARGPGARGQRWLASESDGARRHPGPDPGLARWRDRAWYGAVRAGLGRRLAARADRPVCARHRWRLAPRAGLAVGAHGHTDARPHDGRPDHWRPDHWRRLAPARGGG